MDRLRQMSAPFVPKSKGIRVSTSSAMKSTQVVRTPTTPRESITDAIMDETLTPTIEDKATDDIPQLPQVSPGPPLRNPGRSTEIMKRLPKDRSSGGMDGMNDRSLDFMETDSSDDDPPDREHDVSPRSLVTLEKPPDSPVNSVDEDQTRDGRATTSSAIVDTFDFGLEVSDAADQDHRENSRAQALASLDASPHRAYAPQNPAADDSHAFYQEYQPYSESLSDSTTLPRLNATYEQHPTQPGDAREDSDSGTLATANIERLHQILATPGQSSSGVNQKAMLLAVVTQAILALPDRDKSSRHARTSRASGSPRHPKSPRAAPATVSSTRALFEPSASVPTLPPVKPLSMAKDQPLPLRPHTVVRDQPQTSRPPGPYGILRTPSWGPASARPSHGKQRSMSSPEPSDMQKTAGPSPHLTAGRDSASDRRSTTTGRSFSSPAAEQRATLPPPSNSAPPTPYPQPISDPSRNNPLKQAGDGAHQHSPPEPRSASVRIVEPTRHLSPETQLDQARRNTLASRRRSSLINTAAVSADTILALSVRRRHAPNSRRFVRLVVPADDEIATPAQSRRRSTAAGRKVSIASTDPEKSQEGKDSESVSPKEKREFDDAAFFRKLRDAYYNELLGSSLSSRFFRRYCSAYVLKRITLVSGEGVEDPDPPNITPITRSTRFLTLRGFNDIESEDSLLRHFLLPNLGRASWRWVRWVHRVAISVDQDNAEFEARMRKASIAGPQQRISAVPGGLEFIEGPGVWRLMIAVGAVLTASVMAMVLYITLGPLGSAAYTTEALTSGLVRLPTWDGPDRVVQGVLVGQFMMMFGAACVGMWVVGSRLAM